MVNANSTPRSYSRRSVTSRDIELYVAGSCAPFLFSTDRERARQFILRGLVSGDYREVLEYARRFDIDLSKGHLYAAARQYADRHDSSSLSYAAWAYDRLGQRFLARRTRWRARDVRSEEVDNAIVHYKRHLAKLPR